MSLFTLTSTKEAKPSLLEGIFGQALNYYFWLLALTLAFSSSVIFFKLYLKSKGTPLGKVALYISINSFLWSISVAVLSVPSITMIGIYTDIFLVATSVAGVSSIIAAYYRAIIQGLLTPSEGRIRDFRIYHLLCGLTIAVALVTILRFAVDIPLLNEAISRMSIWGALGIILLAASLIMFYRPRLRRFAYVGTLLALVIGLVVLLGNWFVIRFLFNPFQTGVTSDLTGEGLILASAGSILSQRNGLKAKTAQFVPSTGILLMAALAMIGYLVNLPTLYNGGFYVSLSIPNSICFLLIGLAQIWIALERS